jgi:glutamyl-tRNA reductase
MSPPEFFLLGATHQNTPLAVREKLALGAEAEAEFHAELAALPGLREIALLSTCNRLEFYGVAEEPGAAARLQEAFCARQRFAAAEFEKVRLSLKGRDALQHLLEVAAGLDSQIVGENEIFGQVKDAYAAAQARRSTGPVLNRVFQKVFQAAKHVRTNTRVTAGQVSVANIAVELATNVFGSLSSARVFLIGAGEIGEKTARAFQSRGAASLAVASRHLDRAEALAGQLGAAPVPLEEAGVRLAEFDIVVCATASPEAIVPVAAAAAAMKQRPARPLLFIDLGMPRDVDPAVSTLQNVFLFDLDDLGRIAERNRGAREAETARCREMLTERAEALWRQVEERLLAYGSPAGPAASAPPGGRREPGSSGA